MWIRDKTNNWQSELKEEKPPRTITAFKLTLVELGISASPERIEAYDPWKNVWTTIPNDGIHFTLPDFKRSLVLRWISK